jgi:hypothetical protein
VWWCRRRLGQMPALRRSSVRELVQSGQGSVHLHGGMALELFSTARNGAAPSSFKLVWPWLRESSSRTSRRPRPAEDLEGFERAVQHLLMMS